MSTIIDKGKIEDFFWKQFNENSLADPRGRQGRPLRVQILSFSCGFQQKIWKIIAHLGVGAPPGENPGSATGNQSSSGSRGADRACKIGNQWIVAIELSLTTGRWRTFAMKSPLCASAQSRAFADLSKSKWQVFLNKNFSQFKSS